MSAPEFVAVGHVTLDRFGDLVRPGGAALYAAVTAHRLGLAAGILTSHADDFPLERIPPPIEVVSVSADQTTTFEHRQRSGARTLALVSTARPLTPADVPPDWAEAGLVLLAPVADEVDPLMATMFPDAVVAAAAQGWLRQPGADGVVTRRQWTPPRDLLGRLQVLFLSAEDVRAQEATVVEWFQRVPLGVVTAGRAGALLFVNGERSEVRARHSREVDATGAGDVFATTFLIQYQREGDPWAAAEAAACAAALSVEGNGWSAVPESPVLEAALAEYRRDQ